MGASGFIHQDVAPRELELWTLHDGDTFLSPALSRRAIDFYLANKKPHAGALDALTPRQKEVLKLIAEGKSTKETAIILNASGKTIESHRAAVMERLGIYGIAGLVRYAVRVGLVSSET